MKKLAALILCVTFLLSIAGCANETGTETPSQPEANATEVAAEKETTTAASLAGTKIEVATKQAGDSLEAYKQVNQNFENETGIEIVLTEYSSSDYENVMKTRMASNEMPDVFETHGWSRLRYGEYLYPVNNEPWYEDETELAAGILTGPGDTAYALMCSCSILGIVCNKTACEELGIDIYAIETWDDFTEVCQIAVDAGIVPIVNHSSAGDLTHCAGIFTTYDDGMTHNEEAQLNGTWDWEDNMLELEYFANLIDMGAYWKDRSTMDSTAEIERMATGESLFYIGNGAAYIKTLAEQNPDAEFAIIPFFAASEGASHYFAGGEGFAVGIYNGTENLEACRLYLEYLAAHADEFAMIAYSVKGLESMEVPANNYAVACVDEAMSKYDNVKYVNMWDREYMPSGMWNVYGEAIGMFYEDSSEENLIKINQFLKENYIEKWEAAQAN